MKMTKNSINCSLIIDHADDRCQYDDAAWLPKQTCWMYSEEQHNSFHSLIRSEGVPCSHRLCLLLLLGRERCCFSSGRAPWSPSNLFLRAWRSHDWEHLHRCPLYGWPFSKPRHRHWWVSHVWRPVRYSKRVIYLNEVLFWISKASDCSSQDTEIFINWVSEQTLTTKIVNELSNQCAALN